MMYLLNGLPAFFGTINITGNIIISGQGLFANGTNAAPSISFQSDPDTGLYLDAANTVGIATAGAGTVLFSSSAGVGKIKAHGTRVLALEAGTGNTNITLTPSGTGIGALVNAAQNAQFFVNASDSTKTSTLRAGFNSNLCGDFTLNGSSGILYIDNCYNDVSSSVHIRTKASGSAATCAIFNSSGRSLFGTTTDSGALLQVGTNTTANTGGMVFGTDTFAFRSAAGRVSLYGSAGSGLRVESLNYQAGLLHSGNTPGTIADAPHICLYSPGGAVYLASNGTTALTLDASQNATFAGQATFGTGYGIVFNTRGGISPQADGVFKLYNAANTDFSRLQFGGTTSSFPALKRSGAAIHVRFADDSAYAAIASGVHVVSGSASSVGAGEICYGGSTATTVGATGAASALPALPLGYIIINVAGTSAKIPYYNA